MTSRFYFAYGSNMDIQQMARRCPEAELFGAASLTNYRLAFGGNSVGRCGGVATIKRKTGATTHGVLYLITARDEAALDRCEGVHLHQYRKKAVEVLYHGEMIDAMSYQLIDMTEKAPDFNYWTKIRSVYETRQWDAAILDAFVDTHLDIFIYGSLRQNEKNHFMLTRGAGGTFVRKVRTASSFKLLHLGSYPGMVRGSTRVKGELWRVNRLKLAELDAFEGHPHFFRRSTIALEHGESVEAYLYSSLRGRSEVVVSSGDWARRPVEPPPKYFRDIPARKSFVRDIPVREIRDEDFPDIQEILFPRFWPRSE